MFEPSSYAVTLWLGLAAALLALIAGLRSPDRARLRRAALVVMAVAVCLSLTTLAVPSVRIVDPILLYVMLGLVIAAYVPVAMVAHVRRRHRETARRAQDLERELREAQVAIGETARRAQDLERELREAQVEIATIAPENTRLEAERDFFGGRMAELEAHNRLLTESATERERRVQDLERQLQGRAEVPRQASPVPSILFISIPKSGTVFTGQMLARGVGLERLSLSIGAFPRYALDVKKLDRFRGGGMIGTEHVDASAENLQALAAFIDRWVVHLRDPRSVLLSWVHHLNRLYAERQSAPYELLYVCPTPPEGFFACSFAEQVDWNIEHFLPNVLTWTQRWVEAHDSGRYKILLTTFADILAGEDAFIGKILDFHAIPRDRFQRPSVERTIPGSHFRVGRADEWRDSLTPNQIARMTEMIGDELRHRFGWPQS